MDFSLTDGKCICLKKKNRKRSNL